MRTREFRGNVFVANLPRALSEEELAEAFDPYGIVLSAFMPRDPESGEALGYGFVDIATERAEENAIAGLNGTVLKGRRIEVRRSERTRSAKKPAPSHAPRRGPAPYPNLDGERPPADYFDAAADYQAPKPRQRPNFAVEKRSLPPRARPSRLDQRDPAFPHRA